MPQKIIYGTSEVSKKIGVSKASISNWSVFYFPMMQKTKAGHRLFNEEHIDFFKKAKKCTNNGMNHDQIKVKFSEELELINNPKGAENLTKPDIEQPEKVVNIKPVQHNSPFDLNKAVMEIKGKQDIIQLLSREEVIAILEENHDLKQENAALKLAKAQ